MVSSNGNRRGRCRSWSFLLIALASMLSFTSYSKGKWPFVGSKKASLASPSSSSSVSSHPATTLVHQSRILREVQATTSVDSLVEHDSDTANNGTEKEHHEEEKEEHEVDSEVEIEEATVVLFIVLTLIALTVGFEILKEGAEEKSSEETKLIIEKLFGELTILGFLAMITFIIDKAGVMESIANVVKQDKEELQEYLESVHYTIFCIMVFFVLQVMVLVREAHETETQWLGLEDMAREIEDTSEREWDPTPDEQKAMVNVRKSSWYTSFVPQLVDENSSRIVDTIIFQCLRHEFILDRSLEPPFNPTKQERRLPEDFNFGRYLALAQTHIIMHIVEVENNTWFFFAFSALAFYFLAAFVEKNLLVLSWIWVVLGWLVVCMNVAFKNHLKDLRKVFMPKTVKAYLCGEKTHADSLSDTEYSEQSSLLNDDPSVLPAWCDVRLEDFRRPCLTNLLVRGRPNRQQVFYLLDRRGSQLYIFLLQVNLIFTGLYAAMLLLLFFPVVLKFCRMEVFLLYVLLSVAPIFSITYNKKRLLGALTQVCSVGTYRKVHIVGDVLRESKLKSIVRTFVVLSKIRCLASSSDPQQEVSQQKPQTPNQKKMVRRKLSASDLEEVGKTFDVLDDDGSGELSPDELRAALRGLSLDATEEGIEKIVASFDSDGDGLIDRNEFIEWYSCQAGSMSHKEHAEEVFRMLDSSGSGEISVGEFKHKIDALHFGFSINDIAGIISELDEDRSGTINLEEFEDFLEKYFPTDLD